ncbi:FAD binding domain-containing protein [Xylaria digitata]|nr:FAD binding domain-containing protein [Xylaria digitata]
MRFAVRFSVAQLLKAELAPHLSRPGLISQQAPTRWSSFEASNPGAIVNIETKSDVVATNGGSGWSTFDFGTNGVLINLARLNQVSFNADKTQATIGGGSNISNTIAHAYAAGSLVVTGNCNCVGALGAVLGGGYGNLVGLYGLGVDNVLSLRVITADGKVCNVTAASDPDLFWGLRGAGANFGIVTSATVKAYPALEADMQAWTGSLVFSPDKLEQIVQAIQDLVLLPNMTIFLYFASDGSPENNPTLVAQPFLYKGDAALGRVAYASLYAIGPEVDETSPAWNAGFQETVPATWRQIWDKYVEFQQTPGAGQSGLLLEAYSLTKARSKDAKPAAFPNRDVNFNAFAIPWYDDSSLDDAAKVFGTAARDLWRSTSGLSQVVYGESLPRLKSIKRRVDPDNWFNQWFNIK